VKADTSLLVLPMGDSMSLPFGNHVKLKIRPELKSVNCGGTPPLIA
jgi:hypothetical protein